jgi:hypothetical protein
MYDIDAATAFPPSGTSSRSPHLPSIWDFPPVVRQTISLVGRKRCFLPIGKSLAEERTAGSPRGSTAV